MQALVKHSEAKDQFLRVAVKRMMETQLFEDDLKEVSQLNSVLLTQKLELETRLADERQAKDSKHFTDSLLLELDHVLVELWTDPHLVR
jgi:hypothetical protein